MIPLEIHLTMIGGNIIRQYRYEDQGLSLIDQFSLD